MQESFKALAALAVSLPGIAQGAAPIASPQVQMGFSQYAEDDIADDNVLFGSLERYEIDVSDFSLVTPIGADDQLQLAYSIDEMTGASPWFVLDGGDGYVQAMSGATISDRRKDWLVGWSHFTSDTIYTVQAGRSTENDYDATNFGLSVEHELNNANTVVGVSFSRSIDDISASDSDIFTTRPTDEGKHTNTVALSLSQVINPTLIVRAGLSHETQRGYLSDPYKLASVDFIAVQELRPESRDATVVSLGARQYLTELQAAVAADYRFYRDSWGVDANTLELSWNQSLSYGFTVTPSVRWYQQSRADFYANGFDAGAAVYSSDPRLAAFTGQSIGLALKKTIYSAAVSVSAEKYQSRADDGNALYRPLALVDYTLMTLSVTFDFE